MAEALVSFLVEQLGSFIFQHVEQNVKLVVNVKKEVATLTFNLEGIQAVLADAERRQVKETNVRRWLLFTSLFKVSEPYSAPIYKPIQGFRAKVQT